MEENGEKKKYSRVGMGTGVGVGWEVLNDGKMTTVYFRPYSFLACTDVYGG